MKNPHLIICRVHPFRQWVCVGSFIIAIEFWGRLRLYVLLSICSGSMSRVRWFNYSLLPPVATTNISEPNKERNFAAADTFKLTQVPSSALHNSYMRVFSRNASIVSIISQRSGLIRRTTSTRRYECSSASMAWESQTLETLQATSLPPPYVRIIGREHF